MPMLRMDMSVGLFGGEEGRDDFDEDFLKVMLGIFIAEFGERTFDKELARLDDADVVAELFIFSTHIMSEVEKLCDNIGIIQSGKLLVEGTLAELRDKYAEHDLEEIFVKIVTPLFAAEEAN